MTRPRCYTIVVDGVPTIARFTKPPDEETIEAYRVLVRQAMALAAARKDGADG
jgi:hypothetical protein